MPPSFQFHKGTIKTIDPKLSKRVFDNFNSIKVRLKLRNVVKEEVCKADFNSIKVRLKPSYKFVSASVFQFQFHKGTIKTCVSRCICWWSPYFNSIKVRLKPSLDILPIDFNGFQFHKGTIKTSGRCILRNIYPEFQFHKGTIKTQYFGTNKTFVFEFQFHKGTIKTGLHGVSCWKWKISIP